MVPRDPGRPPGLRWQVVHGHPVEPRPEEQLLLRAGHRGLQASRRAEPTHEAVLCLERREPGEQLRFPRARPGGSHPDPTI